MFDEVDPGNSFQEGGPATYCDNNSPIIDPEIVRRDYENTYYQCRNSAHYEPFFISKCIDNVFASSLVKE